MTLEKFIASLNRDNPSYESLCGFIRARFSLESRYQGMLAKKSNDLYEVTQDMILQERWPLVDKKLGMVFGIERGGHEALRYFLYAYHKEEPSSFPNDLNTDIHDQRAFEYMWDGMGYYISCMSPDEIVVRATYRPDRLDKDLFLLYRVAHTF